MIKLLDKIQYLCIITSNRQYRHNLLKFKIMKNLILLSVIVLFTFISCNKKQEMESKFIKISDKEYFEQTVSEKSEVVAKQISVIKGNTLWDLGGDCLGDHYAWETIFQMNLPYLSDRLEFKELNGELAPWVWIYPNEELYVPLDFMCDAHEVLQDTVLIKHYPTEDKLFLVSDTLPADSAGWQHIMIPVKGDQKAVAPAPKPDPIVKDPNPKSNFFLEFGWIADILWFIFMAVLWILGILLFVLLLWLLYRIIRAVAEWVWGIITSPTPPYRGIDGHDTNQHHTGNGSSSTTTSDGTDLPYDFELLLLTQLQKTGGKISVNRPMGSFKAQVPKQKNQTPPQE